MKFFITDNCIGCGACYNDCVHFCIKNENGRYKIADNCIECGDCYTICPVGAIRIVHDDEMNL